MAQTGISAFFQASSKSSGTGVVRAAALSTSEAKLLGRSTSEVGLMKKPAVLKVSNTKTPSIVASIESPSGGSNGRDCSVSILKHKNGALDLAPAIAKRAKTDSGTVRANSSIEGMSTQAESDSGVVSNAPEAGSSWEGINAEATTSGRPPLLPKYQKKVRSQEAAAEAGQELSEERSQEGSPLTEEQKLRIEVNKATAMAKLAQRKAEDVVAAAHARGETLPRLADLFLDSTWLAALPGELQKAYFANLETFVRQEVSGTVPIYPPQASIFRAFNTCPFERVKVVILGQDPYHGPGQAMGLSFSVPAGVKVPSSLQNIFKELQNDLGCSIPQSGDLQKWAAQGVLLLNTVMTVRQGQANSHAKRGWELFTDAAIRTLSKNRTGVVFLLWGRPAQEKVRLIDASSHHVLKCAHPSGLSAHRGFFGCRHFSQANKLLQDAGQLPIDWQL